MDEAKPWRRRLLIGAGLILVTVLATSWLASSAREVEALGPAASVLVISDAGPVRVRSLASGDEAVAADLAAALADSNDSAVVELGSEIIVRSTGSWLLRRPVVESLTRDGELVVRSTCPSVLPCRNSLEVFVPAGVELTVVAGSDHVQVDSFDGALLVLAGDEGVSLGSVSGSVSVVSDGPVEGATLGPTELTIEVVDDPVRLTYLDVPGLLAVTATDAPVTIELPAEMSYAIDVEADDVTIAVDADDLAEARVSIRSGGPVVVEPSVNEQSE